MLVNFLRHGTASHLLEDYRRKVNHKQFCTLLEEWMIASLTDVGKQEIVKIVEKMKNNTYHLFYSPLKRTKQSAKPFSSNPDILTTQEMPALSEIIIKPPFLHPGIKLTIKSWIVLCVIKSLYTFSFVRYLKEARSIMNEVVKKEKDSLLVSHQARIITLVIYCIISPKWRILKVSVKPAGLTIVEKR